MSLEPHISGFHEKNYASIILLFYTYFYINGFFLYVKLCKMVQIREQKKVVIIENFAIKMVE